MSDASPDPDWLERPLAYAHRLEMRSLDEITLVVVHCTELPDLATARIYGERIRYSGSRTGNSGHVYIDRDGAVEFWVPLERIAHHTRGYNSHSVGIELVNRGRYPDWYDSRKQAMNEAYTSGQIRSLRQLLGWLCQSLPGLTHIAGHEDLDRAWIPASDDATRRVRRKLDPGPRFPWDALRDCGGLVRTGTDGE